MRIRRRIQLAGLAVALAGGVGAQDAAADDLPITTATTTPVTTDPALNGTAGDITISNTGSIAITVGAAVTVNSNNDVTNDGTISTLNSDDTVGILLQ
jgi:hypothetical protein